MAPPPCCAIPLVAGAWPDRHLSFCRLDSLNLKLAAVPPCCIEFFPPSSTPRGGRAYSLFFPYHAVWSSTGHPLLHSFFFSRPFSRPVRHPLFFSPPVLWERDTIRFYSQLVGQLFVALARTQHGALPILFSRSPLYTFLLSFSLSPTGPGRE